MIDIPPEPPFADEQVITQRLLECGLVSGGFSVRYEDYLQSIEVVIAPSAGATSDHFPCIHTAVFPEIVTFEDGAMYQEYMAYVGELFRPQMLADSAAALRERGLLDGFPERGDFPAFADYVRALEAHAGFASATALRAEGDNRLVFDPPRPDKGFAEFSERYSDLLMDAVYAAAKEDLSFGFIGNEKIRE
jgi:hypothetical protein